MKHPLDSLTTLNDGEDRDAWLAARVPVITATQATAIAGSNPYTKLIDVWNEKTDPNYDSDYLRNIYLEERAALGTEREPEIIAWATENERTGGPNAPFVPNKRLVANSKLPGLACTPDGAKKVGRKLILIECKATQQRWDQAGVPQHILDQCYFQLHVTGAFTVWLAVEFYEWSGRGKNKVATLVGTMLQPIQQNPTRLAFILGKIEEFQGWIADDIAPESDVILDTAPDFSFDDTPEQVAEKEAQAAEAARIDKLLTELADVQAKAKPLTDRIDQIKAEVGKVTKQYEGRRVHLVGERMIAKLTRFHRTVVDTKQLDPKVLEPITSWPESSRMLFEVNPEWKEPEAVAGDPA